MLINYLKCFFKRQCLNIDTMDSISDVIPSRKFMMMFNECAIEKFNTNKILFKDGTRKVNEYTVNEYDEIYIMENGRKLCDSDAVLSEDVNECTRIYDKLAKLKPNDFAKGFIKQINSKFTLSTIFNITKFCGFTQQQSYALRKLLWKNVVFLQTARVLIPLINERLHNRLCIRKMRIFSVSITFNLLLFLFRFFPILFTMFEFLFGNIPFYIPLFSFFMFRLLLSLLMHFKYHCLSMCVNYFNTFSTQICM